MHRTTIRTALTAALSLALVACFASRGVGDPGSSANANAQAAHAGQTTESRGDPGSSNAVAKTNLPATQSNSNPPGPNIGSQGDCLSYEPVEVKLTGRVSTKIFPGPPEYTSIKGGDEPEQAWILHLAKPICTKADQNSEVNEAEDHVSDVQLVLRDKNHFSEVRRLNKKGAVTLTGTLFHSVTAHHHAKVLMRVIDIRGQ